MTPFQQLKQRPPEEMRDYIDKLKADLEAPQREYANIWISDNTNPPPKDRRHA